jgi:hypothetical protein
MKRISQATGFGSPEPPEDQVATYLYRLREKLKTE